MKYFLCLSLILSLVGCSSPAITANTYNAVIPLENEEVGIFIPESWEKVTQPSGGSNIILMARDGDENVAVSFEQSKEFVTGTSLCNGAEKGFSPYEQTFVDEDNCFFSGHPAPNTPLRSFWQKIVRVSSTTNFLLVSCSTEQKNASTSECTSILDSFKILDKTE